MILYAQLLLAVLAIMTIIAAVNVFTIPRIRRTWKPQALPFVSVLIPARNEADTIGTCLSSLVAQDYPHYEIIVLDDRSEDKTWEVLRAWEARAPHVRILRGKPLPPGWVGKCYACHQLAGSARGDLLLFTDADTQHSATSIVNAVAALERSNADLLSLLPSLELRSLWEKVVMPMLHFVTFTTLPFPLVHHTRKPQLAMANGQFMLFRRSAYEAVGGHEAVKDALVEDVWLARLVKKHGLRLRVMDGKELVATRMYRSLREIWNGFSKNLFPGFRYSLAAIMFVMVFNVATSVVPFVVAVAGLFGPSALGLSLSDSWVQLTLAQAALLVAIRVMLSLRFSLAFLPIVLHPVAMAIVVGIAANSVRWALFAGGLRWKGRIYPLSRGETSIPSHHFTQGE